MTLQNLLRAQAIFVWVYALLFWVAPEMAAQGAGWTVSENMRSFGQILSVPLFALGLFAWMAPSWVGDTLIKFVLFMVSILTLHLLQFSFYTFQQALLCLTLCLYCLQ